MHMCNHILLLTYRLAYTLHYNYYKLGTFENPSSQTLSQHDHASDFSYSFSYSLIFIHAAGPFFFPYTLFMSILCLNLQCSTFSCHRYALAERTCTYCFSKLFLSSLNTILNVLLLNPRILF